MRRSKKVEADVQAIVNAYLKQAKPVSSEADALASFLAHIEPKLRRPIGRAVDRIMKEFKLPRQYRARVKMALNEIVADEIAAFYGRDRGAPPGEPQERIERHAANASDERNDG